MIPLVPCRSDQLVEFLKVLLCRLRTLAEECELMFGVWFFVLIAERLVTFFIKFVSRSPLDCWLRASHYLYSLSPSLIIVH